MGRLVVMTSIDIIIPVLNEHEYILKCLQTILAFGRPSGISLRIFVVDGGSTDTTLKIVNNIAEEHPEIKILNNPQRIQACALNIALSCGSGEYILRLDAHATYPPDYLQKCVQVAVDSNCDNVGGVVTTLPGAKTYQAQVVQAVTTHRFGVGNSEFRLQPQPGLADTVPFGFFKRSVFTKIGFFDERLVRNQDYEFNRRIVACGGQIWLDPEIVVNYYNQSSIWSFLKKQYSKEGPYNAYLWYLAPYARAYRHGITGLFTAGIIGGSVSLFFSHILGVIYLFVLGLYMTLACGAAIQQAVRYKCALHTFALPPVFFAFHFVHGLGVLSGLYNLMRGIAPVQRTHEPWLGYGSYRIRPQPVLNKAVH